MRLLACGVLIGVYVFDQYSFCVKLFQLLSSIVFKELLDSLYCQLRLIDVFKLFLKIIVIHTIHYGKPLVCRVLKLLPCAQTRAHGKPSLCRVPAEIAHGKPLAHGKPSLCRVPLRKHTAKRPTQRPGRRGKVAVCQIGGTRQTFPFCRVPPI